MADGQNRKKGLLLVYTTEFKVYTDTMPERVNMALEILGGMIESHAKEYCPVDTGRLRNSIKHGLAPEKENTERIGSNVEYAPFVELGHAQQPGRYVPAIGKRLKASHVAGRPYLRPALENHRDEYWGVIDRVFNLTSDIPEGTPQDYEQAQQEPEIPEHPRQEEPEGEGPWVVLE